MVGTTTLGWMEFMCRHGVQKGLNKDQSLGWLPVVVFFGGDAQLPPVLDSPAYKIPPKILVQQHYIGLLFGMYSKKLLH